MSIPKIAVPIAGWTPQNTFVPIGASAGNGLWVEVATVSTAALVSLHHNTLGISAVGNAAIAAPGTYGCIIHSVVYEEKTAATPTISMIDAAGVNYTGVVVVAASVSSSILGSYAASAGGSGAVSAAPAAQLSLVNGAVGDEWHVSTEFW